MINDAGGCLRIDPDDIRALFKEVKDFDESRRERGMEQEGRSINLTCTTENVAPRELPHTSKKLNKATTKDGHAYNCIGLMHSSGLRVEQRENECSRGERK